MEIETETSRSIFQQVPSANLLNIDNSSILQQLDISIQKFSNHSHRLTLTKTHLYLSQLQQQCIHAYMQQKQPHEQLVYATKLDFQLKFQVIYLEHECVSSQKIGINLFRSQGNRWAFYSNSGAGLETMRRYLGRLINQRGFHSQFKPVKKLGKGNFASVYQVLRLQDGKKYAVKAFSKANTYNTQNGKQSLINELSIMRQLSHCSQNILCLEAVYQSDNSIYIVLQLLEGKNLFQIMKEKNGNFSMEEIRVIMGGLLRGIQCMGDRKIMHRDLKPENIMFRYASQSTPNTYQPVIVDFGLAARSDITPYLFYRCGTPGFVAPQIIKIQQNEQYSPSCDMFSIGCIFHLLLTNSPVFTGTKYDEVYKKNKLLEFNLKKTEINKRNAYALILLQKMLESTPITRIPAAQALVDRFFMGNKIIPGNRVGKQLDFAKIDQDDAVTDYPVSPCSDANRFGLQL